VDDRTRKYVERLDRLNARPLAEQLEDDVAPYRDLSPAERARTVEAVLRASWQILRSRADFREVIAQRDEPAPDLESIWKRLMDRHREERRGQRKTP
jgi:hypothetical protein